ncbi:uncharacterized protein LOC117335220 isoform X2 [Pecten maximus]|uniref:uncharacterized protein LOC117335220 isoform X2 n=1 Tax=Pecten maximus TaxID=6579 RepID=UPI001458E3FD|nr:uncharacterized protein LOC117335220 isoform X2 [Pecten maximus]
MGNEASSKTNNADTQPARTTASAAREMKATTPGRWKTTPRNEKDGMKDTAGPGLKPMTSLSNRSEEHIRFYGNTPTGRLHRTELYPFFKYQHRPRRGRDHRFQVKTASTVSDIYPDRNLPSQPVEDAEESDMEDIPLTEADIYDRARRAPTTVVDSYKKLMDYLLKGSELVKQPELIRARAVMIWLSRQDVTSPLSGTADYDTPSKGIVKLSNDTQFEYSRFLSTLYEKAGIKSVEITGVFKTISYDPNNNKNLPATSWNAINLEGRWQLIMPYFVCTRRINPWFTSEPTIKGVSKDDERGHVFNYFYFLMDPKQSINWFYPDDPKWQLLKRPLQKEEYLNLPLFRSEFFELGLKLESQNSYDLHAEDGRVRIDISSSEELADEIYLWYDITLVKSSGKHNPVTHKMIIHDNLQKLVAMIKQKDKWMFQMTLPIEGVYKVTIYGSVNGDDFGPIVKFRLHCDKRFDKCSMFPEDPKEVGFGPGLAAKDGGLLFPSRSNGFYPVRENSVFRLSFVLDRDTVDNVEVTCSLAQTEETGVKQYSNSIQCNVDRSSGCVEITVTIPGGGVFMLSVWTKLDQGSSVKTKISKLACCYILISNPDIPQPVQTRRQRETRENLRQALEAGTLDGIESAITKCGYQHIPMEDEEVEYANTRAEILRLSRGETQWNQMARDTLKEALQAKNNMNVAKNVILFIGDGMGVSTVTAARIYKGQRMGNLGEETVLSFEKFPHVALSKIYSVDRQTPDSAATATALMCGVKTNNGVLGVKETVQKENCGATAGQEVKSILKHFIAAGRSTGIVTTSRVTHATPAAAYAHSASRDWEGDALMTSVTGGCKDIAYQLVYDNNDIQVVLGGGRGPFLPSSKVDPETQKVGWTHRRDGHDLIEIWKQIHSSNEHRHSYVWRKDQFDSVDPAETDYLLGLFDASHIPYENDRDKSAAGDPSLAEMTSKAIKILKKNQNGYFLMVEGARIDHAHHDNEAKRSLVETLMFEEAVSEALRLTSTEDTLIIVTADHSHPFNIAGYSYRGNDILGITIPYWDEPPRDGLPYTTLVYGNGPGRRPYEGRANYTGVDTSSDDFKQEAAVPLSYETHSGEDVGIYALGPMAHLLYGVQEQHYVAHVMQYAACVGDYKDDCKRPDDGDSNGGHTLSVNILLFVTFCIITSIVM